MHVLYGIYFSSSVTNEDYCCMEMCEIVEIQEGYATRYHLCFNSCFVFT